MSNLSITQKILNDGFKLADLQSDLNALNNDKLEKASPTATADFEINKNTPTFNFNANRTNKTSVKWNANSDADYGLAFIVDGNAVFLLKSDGSVQRKDIDGSWVDLATGGKSRKSVNVVANIQACIDSLSSAGGGVLYIQAGTYNITATILVPSNVKIIGLGYVKFLRSAVIDCLLRNKADGTTGGYGANSNIIVENITFDGNNTADTCTLATFGHAENVAFVNCQFINLASTWHLVEYNAVKRGYIRNCIFDNYTGGTEALQLDFMYSSTGFPWFAPYDNTVCTDIFIENNRFSNITGSAIGNHAYLANCRTTNAYIRGNRFENISIAACALSDTYNLHFEDNYIFNASFGLYAVVKQAASQYIYVERNFYDGQKRTSNTEGRFVSLANDGVIGIAFVKIKDNTSINAGRHAIGFTAHNVNITDNVVTASAKNGIYAYGCDYLTIQNNYVRGNGTDNDGSVDIKIGNNATTAVSYAKVEGNYMDTYLVGTNIIVLWTINNGIRTSATKSANPGAEITKDNIVSGSYKATGYV